MQATFRTANFWSSQSWRKPLRVTLTLTFQPRQFWKSLVAPPSLTYATSVYFGTSIILDQLDWTINSNEEVRS